MKYTVYLQSDSETVESNHVSDRLSELIIDEINTFLETNNITEEIEFTIDIRNMKKSKQSIGKKDIVIEKMK